MLKMPAVGRGRDEVLETLGAFRARDVSWRDGKTFAYVYHASEEATAVAERAFQMYLWENALDPTVFPSLLEIETQIVAMAASHLGGDAEVVGNFTSGGTESVLLAVKTARDFARSRRPALANRTERGEVILPVTAHPCFHKACAYLDLDAVIVPVDPTTYRADVGAIRDAISPRTVLIAASAPSYAHGVIDPIEEIGAVALEHEVLFHVDGCIGGFLLPFFEELGATVPPFDFRVPGVTSMSMDFHKYAFAAKGASVVLHRSAELRRHQIFTWSGWPGYSIVNPTVQSSKSGGPLAATWAVLQFLGHDGYLGLARALKGARDQVVEGIARIDGLRVLGEPAMTLVAIGVEPSAAAGVDVFGLCDEMTRRGWTMHPQMALGELEASFHLTLMPLNIPNVSAWLIALEEALAAVRAAPANPGASMLSQAAASIDFDTLTDAQIEQLLGLAGLRGGALPGGDMAEVNRILNTLPPAVTDRVLTVYFNELSRYRERNG